MEHHAVASTSAECGGTHTYLRSDGREVRRVRVHDVPLVVKLEALTHEQSYEQRVLDNGQEFGLKWGDQLVGGWAVCCGQHSA